MAADKAAAEKPSAKEPSALKAPASSVLPSNIRFGGETWKEVPGTGTFGDRKYTNSKGEVKSFDELNSKLPSKEIPKDAKSSASNDARPSREFPQGVKPVAKPDGGVKWDPSDVSVWRRVAKDSGITDINKIKPGQELKLPDGTKHTVKSGETLSGILRDKAPVKKTGDARIDDLNTKAGANVFSRPDAPKKDASGILRDKDGNPVPTILNPKEITTKGERVPPEIANRLERERATGKESDPIFKYDKETKGLTPTQKALIAAGGGSLIGAGVMDYLRDKKDQKNQTDPVSQTTSAIDDLDVPHSSVPTTTTDNDAPVAPDSTTDNKPENRPNTNNVTPDSPTDNKPENRPNTNNVTPNPNNKPENRPNTNNVTPNPTTPNVDDRATALRDKIAAKINKTDPSKSVPSFDPRTTTPVKKSEINPNVLGGPDYSGSDYQRKEVQSSTPGQTWDTGTPGTKLTTRSTDEIAWDAKNPYKSGQYPGPGWQDREKAQADKNLEDLKGSKLNPANWFKEDIEQLNRITALAGRTSKKEITESTIMNDDIRKMLALLDEAAKMTDIKGKKHTGKYGTEYQGDDDDDDDDSHRDAPKNVGGKGTPRKKKQAEPAEKKGRGRPKKDSNVEAGKYKGADDAAKHIIGGKAPSGKSKLPSKKHTLKDWVEYAEQALNESIDTQTIIEGMDPKQKERLKDLISDFENATDPNRLDYDYDEAESILGTIRSLFGDKIANQVEAGEEKMHFGRPGHDYGSYDDLKHKFKARITKAGKMHQQDVETRKDDIKQKFNLEEKAVSKAQQKFMGMVHAAQKGKKPASKEVAKVAKTMGKKDAKDFASTKHKGLPEKVKEENYTVNKKPVSKDTYDATMKAAGKQPSPEKVKEELKGGQVKLDKNKNGKLDSQDFKMMSKKKVKEGVNFAEMMKETQMTIEEMLEGLQQEIAEFKATGSMGEKLRDALDVHKYSGKDKIMGEMSMMSQPVVEEPVEESPFTYAARQAKASGDDSFKLGGETFPVTESEGVEESGLQAYLGNKKYTKPGMDALRKAGREGASKEKMAKIRARYDTVDEGSIKGGDKPGDLTGTWSADPPKKGQRDVPPPVPMDPVYPTEKPKQPIKPMKESLDFSLWDNQLEKIINESLTISTTQGDHGGDDSVSVTASGAQAQEIMALLRNAGIGGMGGGEESISPEHEGEPEQSVSAYGVPMSSDPEQVEVGMTDDGTDMLSLIKRLTGLGLDSGESEPEADIEVYSVDDEEGSEDYADEEDSDEDHDQEHDNGEEDSGEESDEEDSEENEEASDEEDSSDEEEKVDEAYGKADEGNAFTGKLAHTQQGDEFELDGKKYKDSSSLEEGEGMCQECGMSESECSHNRMDETDNPFQTYENLESARPIEEELANGADDQDLQDIKFMIKTLSGGLNREKSNQTTLPYTAVRVNESKDMILEWKKLSGIK
jgi:hypothetical protein